MNNLEIQVKNLTLEDVSRFSPNDIRRTVAIVFTHGAPLKGIFLDRIIPVREKQEISLPFLSPDEAYGLFHADKRNGLILAEFSGAMESMIVRQSVDSLAEIAGKIGGGFFPAYRGIAGKRTTIIGYNVNDAIKLHGANVHDVRLTDNEEIIFIFRNTEVKKISIAEAFSAVCNLTGKGQVIYRANKGETIFCLDRVKNGKIKAATSDGIYTINLSDRFVEKDAIQPKLPEMPISAYHEISGFTAIVGGIGSNRLMFLPMPNYQPTAA